MEARIQIPGFRGNPEPQVKILGIHVDSKLSLVREMDEEAQEVHQENYQEDQDYSQED
ncbi:hypothetical protein GTA08_BOTSDO03766 [Botryosphaeria dothidea]|uniref:Uncharacterized protein n=1 Tax=Botryosphaeria dothidea TaxID=55169 RepID=A0A8H4N6L1_9PEZI|nr:hypothetical protein GTA08_BOTSDO03766 [Botryosphaeria dothidea]